MPRGRAGVVLGAALLIVAGAAAIGWLALYRHRGPETQAVAGGTVSSRSSAGSTGDARTAAGATLPPDDRMQPYRGMTLDQAFDEVARRVQLLYLVPAGQPMRLAYRGFEKTETIGLPEYGSGR